MKVKKEDKKRLPYVIPFCEVITGSNEGGVLAGSPNVGTTPSVEDPIEDDEDTEISGAKKFNLWTGWDE